ncbi:MAG: transcriptional activator RfaH [Verrucomicrobiales bacterium]
MPSTQKSRVPEETSEGWYCVRAKPKSEHLAAVNLQGFAHLDEVFCPRIRYEKSTRRGKVWFVEALFPGYLFARFDLAENLRAVNATSGVSGILRFADYYPQISDDYIRELREEFPEADNEVRIVEPEVAEGDEVVVTEGPLAGLETIITKLVSGQDRVRVLLEWLGQEREAEVSLRSLGRPGEIRRSIRGA